MQREDGADCALIVVDVQNDFCPGGALAVPGGDEVVPVLNEYIARFRARGLPIFFSRDWHPERTTHFAEWGGPWPPHCIQNTAGAAFHPGLELPPDAEVVSKGMEPDRDSYSAFHATTGTGAPLATALRERGIRTVYVGGLATDYCVRATVLDAVHEGFDAVLLEDASRGIDASAGDIDRAVAEMRAAGTRVETLPGVERELSTGVAPGAGAVRA